MRKMLGWMLGALFLIPVAFGGEEKLVLHEWGVWIRGEVQVQETFPGGKMEKAKGTNTLLGAPDELIQGLPAFVLRHSKEYQPHTEQRGWNKPVIHLYGPEGLGVSVDVKTAQGYPTAYWPKPSLDEVTRWRMGSGTSEAVGLRWKGKLSAQEPAHLPAVPSDHWWSLVRRVPAMYANTEDGNERFLFYEATALQEPLVTGRVEADALVLSNAHSRVSGPVIVIVNDGKTLAWQRVESIPAQGQVKLGKEDLLKRRAGAEDLLEACRAQWISFGLTHEEARAIMETWKEDLTHRLGFLVISRMPADVYEKMFPLTVQPPPAEIVRAGVVFDTLPGETGRLGWLPGLEEKLAAWAKDLSHEEYETRTKAKNRLAQLGDLIQPFLENLRASKDPETANVAAGLLELLKPREMIKPLGSKPKP